MYRIARRDAARVFAAAILIASTVAAACSSYSNVTGPITSPGDDTSLPRIVWGPAPAVFQHGAEMAVIQGDPSKSEPFTVRLRFPDGYKVAPHTHPTDENLTVISGVFKVGMGETFNESALAALPAGGFVTAPALHYAKAQGITTVQVHAMGPFALTYINPADLPH